MKKLLVVLAVITVMAISYTGLSACGNEDGHKGKEMDYQGLKFLNEKIGLSDEQIHNIIKLDSDFKTKYYDNRNDKSKLDALRKEHHKQFHNILTEDQRKKLDEFKSKKGG